MGRTLGEIIRVAGDVGLPCPFPQETSDTQTIIRHPRTIDDKINLIHDFRHLMCTRAIDGEKTMSHGILRGKQVIKCANTSSRGQVCLFYKNEKKY